MASVSLEHFIIFAIKDPRQIKEQADVDSIPDGFRVARVKEVKQALRREWEVEEQGGEASKHLQEHGLLPGPDKAFRLKDGYLLDFGALKSFYPQYEHNLFKITHKLLVSTSVPDVDVATRSESDAALELLHACDEEDEEEIHNIVTGYQQQLINLEKDYTKSVTSTEDDVMACTEGSAEMLAERGSKGQPAAPTVCVDDGLLAQKIRNSSSGQLVLLYAATPWVNGGTALHFSARANKRQAVQKLLFLEKQTFCQLGLKKGSQAGGVEECDDIRDDLLYFESSMVCQEDHEGNTPICSAALAPPDNAEQYSVVSIPKALLNADAAIKNRYQRHMEHENMIGLTPMELALGHGRFRTWSSFHAESELLLKRSINKNEEAWRIFLQKRGVYKAWLLLLSGYANEEHFRQELDKQCERLNLSEYVFEPKNSTDKPEHLLKLFLKALEVGFFPYCRAFLTNKDGKSQLRGLVMGNTTLKNNYARNDVYGNNVLHLYAQGGVDENYEAVNDQIWKLLEDVLNEKGLLQKHADAFNLQGLTPFMLAVKNSHCLACRHLKPHSSDRLFSEYIFVYNDADKFGENIMHWYAKSQPNIPFSSWIIPQNVDVSQLVSVENSAKQTPLELAFDSGHTEACLWLLDHVNLDDETYKLAIYWYAEGSAEREAGKKLLEKLGEEKKNIINQEDEDYLGRTPLMAALAAGNSDACHLLLDQVGCIKVSFEEEVDSNGNNLLHCWCLGGILDKALWDKLTSGREAQVAAHINKQNIHEYTPFMLALQDGKVEFCKWLLEKRDDIVLRNTDDGNLKSNVFHAFVAGKCRDEWIWGKLIKAHMQTSSSSSNHLSLLDKAMKQHGVIFSKDPGVISKKGTPFNLALQIGSEDCALLFLRGLPAEIQFCNDESVLKCAAEGLPKSFKVWAELIKKRHINSTAWSQNKILHEALRNLAKDGSLEVFDMMLQTLEEDIPPDKLLKLLNAKDYDVVNYGETVVSHAARCQAEDSGAACLQLLDMRKGVIFSSPPPSSIMKKLTTDFELDVKLVQENAVFSAISESNVCACSWLLRNKKESPLQENELKAALWLAATRDDSKGNNRDEHNIIAVFKVLLKGNKDPKSVLESLSDIRGNTLIHVIKTPELISYILEISPSLLEKKNREGFTPLFESGSLKKMHVLVDKYKRLDRVIRCKDYHKKTTLLHMQIKDFEKMAKLIQWIVKIESVIDQGGETILHAACKGGFLKVVRLIVNTNPDLLSVTSLGGKTPFHVAVGSSQMLIVEELLRRIPEGMSSKVLLDERDGDGRTALHFAARSKDCKALETVKLLLEKAKSTSISGSSDTDYRSLLLWASAGPIIRRPIDNSQRMDVREYLQGLMNSIKNSKDQFSLLDDAARKGSKAMVKELINRGANIGSLSQHNIGILNTLEFNNKKESDQPTIKDSLGRVKLAKGIAALLLNPFLCTPITVGVFAPWGMGKSSVMQQIETSLMMTIIHRNLLGAHLLMVNDFPNPVVEEKLSKKGVTIRQQVLQIAKKRDKRELNNENLAEASPRSSHRKVFSQFASWIRQIWSRLQTPKREKIGANNLMEIRKFFNEYHLEFDQLYKGLALMEREALVVSMPLHGTLQDKLSFHISSFLTVRYNAWAYHGEAEASAGLAMTILREIEACLGTARWLRLCFKCAYRLNPVFMISGLLIPTVVCVAVGGWIMWLAWKLLSIKGNDALKSVQYGSIPVSVLVVTWFVLQKVLNIVKPISEQLVKSLQHKKGHEEKLGYQRQVIEDIQMFKEELTCEPPNYIWRVFAMFWNVLVTNRDYIEGTRIAKGVGRKRYLRIVVFVDDLDRCISDKYILELLTTINLVLSVCDINVVMGVDKSFVEKAIHKVYDNKEAEVKFLEKIVQVPVDLFDPSEHDITNFLDDQLRGMQNKKEDVSTSKSKNQLDASSVHDSCHDTSAEATRETPRREFGESSIAGYSVPASGESMRRNGTHNSTELSNTLHESMRNGSTHESMRNGSTHQSIESSVSHPDSQISSEASITIENSSTHSTNFQFKGEDVDNELVVDFPILLSNYNEIEVKTFHYLRPKARGEQRQPRNWKRFLNYHRLVWSIISQYQNENIQDIYGWQEQLILWVFLCYNWKEQMNEIFKEWDKLFLTLRSRTRKTSEFETCTLRTIIELKISTMASKEKQLHKSVAPNDNPQISLSKKEKREWKNLLNTINGAHDVTMQGVKIFQNFRFHCDVGRLRWA